MIVEYVDPNGYGVTDHGLLTGLGDDDHSLYLLASDATSRAAFAANWLDLTDAGATTLHKHSTSGVLLPTGIGTPTVDDLQDYIQYTGSAGFYSGGTITNGAAGKINIAAVEGFIRTSASDTADIVAFKLAAQTDVTIPSDTIRYVYVDYNGGSPAIALSASEFDEEVNYVLIGVAINEGGTIVHKANVGVRLDESIAKAGQFMRCVLGISRCNRRGGLIIGETGTRNLTLTTGRLWWGRTEYEITAVDTSVSGTVAFNYYTGAAWTSASSAQWPNTQYNDITSGLVTMTANRWAVLWFYLTVDDTFQCVYGRDQYTTQAAAEQEAKPSTLPNDLSAMGILVGRAIFQKSASTATWYSAFTTTFNAIGITDHGDLSGLSDDDHTQYFLANATREISSADPELTLHNTTEEDTSYGRESKIVFMGEQSGGEISTLGALSFSHWQTGDDEYGVFRLMVNEGGDGANPTTIMQVVASGPTPATTISGTVNGRDLAADGTTLDGVPALIVRGALLARSMVV